MIIARQGGVKRPPKVTGSIQFFDKTVKKAQENYEFPEKQSIPVDVTRKRLVSSKVKWIPGTNDEWCQLRRINSSWNPPIVQIPKEVVGRESPRSSGDDDELLQTAVSELVGHDSDEELTESKVQVRDISAGGVSVSEKFPRAAGGFGVLCGGSRSIPFASDDLCAAIRLIEEDVERGYLVFYFRFTNIGRELREGAISYVYEKCWSKVAGRGADKTTRSVVGPS